MKIGRNDPCWCNSGKKYKQCHAAMDEKIAQFEAEGAKVPPYKIIKTPEQLDGIRKAGKLNTAVLDMVAEKICAGMSTEDINTIVHEYILAHGGTPATLGYCGYPKSVCTSVNDVICHGIPSPDEILKDGDIVNVDVTTILDGYYADASRMFCIGEVSPEAKKLVEVTKESVDLALKVVKPWGFLGDIGYVVSQHIYEHGYTVLHDIGGHGVGNDFHEDPYVCHVGERGKGMLLVPGMVFTIEPMVNAGEEDFYQDEENGWTIYTEDGSLSAQWEYTVAVTEDGVEIITH
ncbi:type I methionyl aminopeptidase [Anaerotignum sp. MB30-C6]|uniref:type I methionyl aminopeptidase n=1 Tax=Anaerotignum sp. MB30-C6 TaxID=3070814 RepID=UPI0027DAF698|nr:type I methionyl aminopeptidase [Anaerotignum sp. MB30-C6]WMI80865.1 type I methionyl aminopeptidase [Anaerotignum sp. MB30-C6]